ncbi:MFS transporter [Enteractinococcus fodinae]|uniref:MFS family permease n=1 Tax=Enteractinococcus fodinae TaxID=684663 RepID=A0ABU2AYW8_9MICC|nr:MFS transporter [Enteractinococcus fodinae]MDR7346535.1 MFS family permease [Enteractinococcus fodinae]
MSSRTAGKFLAQPASVWAITFATAVSFVGIGLVSPILPTIANELQASAFESMLLFTSSLLVTAGTMFFAGFISTRIGIKATLVSGLVLIIIFAGISGLSDTIGQIIGLRAGWGFGNALFFTMALAGIVGAANGGSAAAIILYEAALGMGMALGPLVGGTLGTISWRAPFLGTALLTALAATTIAIFVKPLPKPDDMPISVGFSVLRRRPLLVWSAASLCANFTVICVLAYAPHALAGAAKASGAEHSSLTLGLVFFGWGSALAIFSLVLPRLMSRYLGLIPAILTGLALMASGMLVLALNIHNLTIVIVGIILMGGLQGVTNTLFTEAALNATSLPHNIASSSFSALRFLGGAIFPLVSAPLIALWGAPGPFWGSLLVLVLAACIIVGGYRVFSAAQRQRGRIFSRAAGSVPTHTRSPGA